MKIAFEKRLPDPELFFQLVNECGEGSGQEEAGKRYALLQRHSDRVVAAYDGDVLVAVGAQDAEFGGEWSATVRSDYAKRDLESNMKKLLVYM
ncbi:hypothetical protein [Paenibacillus alkalitolerans]|uniref:hypothetical protein n=1 Tax=Paenibacillus alkalitolerans TaxID=2799335 RepID=UPI0018F6EF16|nr:hypothetical protein [Paenibacillus alkalitolerans]